MASSGKIPVWLDCDPGHDDAFAMLLACYHPGIELLGISTVFGNASIWNTTRNASSVLTAIGKRDVPVYQGAGKALHRPALHPPTDIHGVSGIDGTSLLPEPLAPIISQPEEAQVSSSEPTPAVLAMATALSNTAPRTAWVVATGCMTNVASLLLYRPDLASHIAGVSAMAGSIGNRFSDAVLGPPVDDPKAPGGKRERIGNWTTWAEWNVLADPEAAKIVVEECEGLKGRVTLIPLDLTHQVLAVPDARELLLRGCTKAEESNLARQEARPIGEGQGITTLRTMLVELLMFYSKTYKDTFNIPAPPMHDPLALAVVLTGTEHEIKFYEWDRRVKDAPSNPERFSVKVVTEGTHEEAMNSDGPQTGRTIAELLPEGEPGVRIPRAVDIEQFWSVIEKCLSSADAANARAATEG